MEFILDFLQTGPSPLMIAHWMGDWGYFIRPTAYTWTWTRTLLWFIRLSIVVSFKRM